MPSLQMQEPPSCCQSAHHQVRPPLHATSCMLMHRFTTILEPAHKGRHIAGHVHLLAGDVMLLDLSATTVMQADLPMLAHGTSWTLCTRALGSCVTSTNSAYVVPLFRLQLMCYMLV